MRTVTTTERDALLSDLENLWDCLDELMGSFTPADWSRKHGPDWIFADLPYHLAYFDRELVAEAIERGPHVPVNEQQIFLTMRELNDWNARHFAQRPAGQTVEQSLQQMRSSRDAIRAVIASLSDADLDRPGFCPLPGCGWLTARRGLQYGIGHTWSHLVQLRLHAKRDSPEAQPSVVHQSLAMYVGFMPMALNREAAAKLKKSFRVVMEFTGPGGDTFTIQVADGTCQVTEGETRGRADLVMSQSPVTFVKTMNRMHNPMLALLTGKMKVRGMRQMGMFAKLFPPLDDLDTVLETPVENRTAPGASALGSVA